MHPPAAPRRARPNCTRSACGDRDVHTDAVLFCSQAPHPCLTFWTPWNHERYRQPRKMPKACRRECVERTHDAVLYSRIAHDGPAIHMPDPGAKEERIPQRRPQPRQGCPDLTRIAVKQKSFKIPAPETKRGELKRQKKSTSQGQKIRLKTTTKEKQTARSGHARN